MKQIKSSRFSLLLIVLALALFQAGCRYSFTGASIGAEYRTVRVNFIENRAPYVNPQLSPNLTDRIRQKIINQTRLVQTNNEDTHYDIKGTITDYSVTTTGITSANGQSQTSINRLNVTVQVSLIDVLKKGEGSKDFSVTRQFDFSASQSIQQAESQLLDEMVRNLTDEIFNRLFSDW
ncbi:MAG TPA: LPS assembly lipoprotein LptE [Flavisolibacter sp.]|nr:LPS assembly lipoprotein LptE [Flavisolibacter sp.]